MIRSITRSARALEFRDDAAVGVGMANRVVEQVADHLTQQRVVAGQTDLFCRRRSPP